MEDLIGRLEAAEVGSRELDCEIYAIENPHMKPVRSQIGRFFDPKRASEHSAEKYHISGGATGTAARYTTSIDAAIAMANRVLPGQEYEIATIYNIARVALNVNHGSAPGPFYGSNGCCNVPLAICAAILRAKQIDTAQNPR